MVITTFAVRKDTSKWMFVLLLTARSCLLYTSGAMADYNAITDDGTVEDDGTAKNYTIKMIPVRGLSTEKKLQRL